MAHNSNTKSTDLQSDEDGEHFLNFPDSQKSM